MNSGFCPQAHTYNADKPLVPGQPRNFESLAAKLDNDRLHDDGSDDDGHEKLVREESFEAVELIVDAPAVDLVEDLSSCQRKVR